MSKLSIEIDVPEGVNSKELEVKFAATASRLILEQTILRLYQNGEISTGTGAHLLGMSVQDFIQFLNQHHTSIFHYDEGELAAELERARKQGR